MRRKFLEKIHIIRRIMQISVICWLTACSVHSDDYQFAKIKSFSPSAYYNWAESAPDNELNRERLRLVDSNNLSEIPVDIVQYAIILSMIDDNNGMDIHEVTRFLKEKLKGFGNIKNRHMNAYMTFGLIWQRQLELEINNGSIKDSTSQADVKIQVLEDKIQSLESTIRAFTDIEQELNERDDNESSP